MTYQVKKNNERRVISKVIRNTRSTKLFDPTLFVGKIEWPEEPLAFQKRLRNEWK